jgi:hypothetical protein
MRALRPCGSFAIMKLVLRFTAGCGPFNPCNETTCIGNIMVKHEVFCYIGTRRRRTDDSEDQAALRVLGPNRKCQVFCKLAFEHSLESFELPSWKLKRPSPKLHRYLFLEEVINSIRVA